MSNILITSHVKILNTLNIVSNDRIFWCFFGVIFTARKRSLQRLCFLHLSVSHSVHMGGLCLRDLCSGVSVWGSLSGSLCLGGVSVWGSLSRGVSVWVVAVLRGCCLGGLCLGDLCPRGLCPGWSLSRGLCPGESLSRGYLSGGSLGSLSEVCLCLGVSVPRGFCLGFSVWGFLSREVSVQGVSV